LNRIEVKVEEKRMVGDYRRWDRGERGRACTNKMFFAQGSTILALSLRINYIKISKSACVYRIALDFAVTSLLNVEVMQIMKFDIARIKAVEWFNVSAFLTFCLYFNHFNKKLSYRRGTARCVVS